jgi:hypothetical protein
MGTEVALPQHCYPTQRRRWTRYSINLPVRIVTLRAGRVMAVEGRGSDLNRGGMAVTAGIGLCTCEQVTLEFTPAGSGQTVRLKCAVRNRTGRTYGMEFIVEDDVDFQNARQLESILAKLYYPAWKECPPD